MTKFTDLGLNPLLMKAIAEAGYETPTPIQAQAIPHLLQDKDLLGIAQTGTGKTAAFALPTLDFLLEYPEKRRGRSARVLVLAPTRELADNRHCRCPKDCMAPPRRKGRADWRALSWINAKDVSPSAPVPSRP